MKRLCYGICTAVALLAISGCSQPEIAAEPVVAAPIPQEKAVHSHDHGCTPDQLTNSDGIGGTGCPHVH